MPNQHFYDFQWRALNLCSEFYNAAEELIVSTIAHGNRHLLRHCMQKNAPPMVIAQCYHSGPANKIDPLGLIAEAKRVCDSLVRTMHYAYDSPTFSFVRFSLQIPVS